MSNSWENLVRWRHTPALSTVLITAGATILTALLGFILEELLPPVGSSGGNTGQIVWSAMMPLHWRMIVLLVPIFLLIIGFRLRSARQTGFGTVFYIRLRRENTPNLHEVALYDAQRHVMDFRTATRWFRPPGELFAIVDVEREVSEICTEIERATNDDEHATGFTVVPDLIFPTGLFVGWNWEPAVGAQLRDFTAPPRELPKPGRLPAPGQSSRRHRKDITAYLSACEGFSFNVHLTDEDVALAKRLFDPNRDIDPVGSIDCWPRRILEDSEQRRQNHSAHFVWLAMNLSKPRVPPVERPTADVLLESLQTTHAVAKYADRWRIVTGFHGEGTSMLDVQAYGDTNADATADGDALLVHCRQLGLHMASWIRLTLTDYPKATILLSVRAPKTAQIAAGWYLATQQLPVRGPAADPWSRIVPMWHEVSTELKLELDHPLYGYRYQTHPTHLLDGYGPLSLGRGVSS